MTYTPGLNGGRINVSLGGNSTSAGGGYSLVSTGTLYLAGGNNVTLSQNANTVTISAANQTNAAISAANGSSTFQTASFANSNGVSFSTGTQGIYATVKTDYLTTARASNDALGLNTAQSNVTWTANSSGLSLDARGYAGTATTFNGANISGSITQNSAGLNLSLSAAAPGAGGGIALANSQTTYTSGTANLNVAGGAMTIASTTGQSFNFSVPQTSSLSGTGAISISTNGGTISLGAPYPAYSGSNGSFTTGTAIFANSNGVSFGTGTQGIFASITSQTNQSLSYAMTGNTTGNTSGVSVDARSLTVQGLGIVSAGISTSAGGSSLIMSATQSNQAFSAGAASSAFQTLSFQDSNGVSFSNNAGAVRVTHDLQYTSATSAITANALNTSVARVANIVAATNNTGGGTASLSSNVSFTNANNVTFYTSAGGAIAASIAGGAADGYNSAQFTNSTANTTMPIVWAGNSNGSGNITMGLTGSTVTASAAAGGGGGSKRWQEVYIRPIVSNMTNLSAINATPIFQPIYLDASISISRLNWEMSRATSGSNAFTVYAGIYSYNNDTQISLLGAAVGSYSNTATASVSGVRRFGIAGFNTSTFAPGGYVLGMLFSATNTASMNYSLRGGQTSAPQLGAILEGTDQYNTATSYNIFPFWGRYTASSSTLPNFVNDADVRGQFSGASQALNWWVGLNND